MATSVPQAFQVFKSNLEITSLQESTVASRQQAVRSAVERQLLVKESFLTGSYRRHTLIAPLSEADIDIFVVLDSKYYYELSKPASLLDKVRNVLRETYPQTPGISRNGQAVTIRFTDFLVDVVPAFYRQGGGFLIPNSVSGTWISTNPKVHVELVTQSNQAHNGDLVPLIKMLKCWNKVNDSPFRSFHLEVMALAIFTNITISDYPSGVRYFLDKARNHVRLQNLDPAGLGGDVGAYLKQPYTKLEDAAKRFERAYQWALAAEEAGRNSRASDAIARWRTLFGDYFPAYG